MRRSIGYFVILILILNVLSFNHFHDVEAIELGDVYGSCPSCSEGELYLVDLFVEPSCTENGSGYVVCRNCGYGADVALPATGHNYELLSRDNPTCLSSGTNYYVCNRCKDQYSETVAALGHNYTSAVSKEADCTSSGIRHYSCNRCNDSYDETIPALGHDYETSISKEPTCTQAGTEDYICKRCGESYFVNLLALGHNYISETTKKPTCEEDGLMTYTCSRCNDSYQKKIPALGHDYLVEEKEATCLETGEKISTCKQCGDVIKETTKALGHDLDEYKTIKEATCIEDGEKETVCKRCNEIIHEIVSKLGHDYPEDWIIEKQATYFSEGIEYKICNRCNEKTTQVIPNKNPTPLLLVGTGIIVSIVGIYFGLKKSRFTKKVKELEDNELSMPEFEDKSIAIKSADKQLIDFLKSQHYLEVSVIEENLEEEVTEADPDLVLIENTNYQSIKKVLKLKEEELADYEIGMIVPDKLGKKTKELLDKAIDDKMIINYVRQSDSNYRKFVKLVLPILKPNLKSDESLGNIGMVADMIGIPGVSDVINVYVSGRDIKAILEEGELGVAEKANIIADIASILGLDTVESVAGLVDDAESIKAALNKDKGAYEEKTGINAAKDVVDVVSDLIDRD